jgi:cytochrome c
MGSEKFATGGGAAFPRAWGREAAMAAALAAFTCLGAGTSLAAGDTAKGKAAFIRQCAICHTVDKGGENRLGPNLFGIIGRKAASVPEFDYTRAFKNTANWVWIEDLVGGWISNPGLMVPGTAMGVFQGVSEKDRDDIVAYLGAQK